jgi:nitrogen fixation/metabolism regulation signal transduction histidine kinase
VTVSAQCDGPKFAVTVEDTGVGIGEDDLPRLRSILQARVLTGDDGSGLGLPSSRVAWLHGGDLDIKAVSAKERGDRAAAIDCEAGRPVDPMWQSLSGRANLWPSPMSDPKSA